MKKTFVLVSMMMIAASTFCQQTNPATALTKQDYMQKSKKQKTVAWVLLGGGATFVLTGIVIPKGDLVQEGWFGNSYENDGVKGTFELIGLVSMIGSIPFFTASKKNNKRAMSFSFKNEPATQLVKSSLIYRSVPSLNLNITL
jgi:hypothetical protein